MSIFFSIVTVTTKSSKNIMFFPHEMKRNIFKYSHASIINCIAHYFLSLIDVTEKKEETLSSIKNDDNDDCK